LRSSCPRRCRSEVTPPGYAALERVDLALALAALGAAGAVVALRLAALQRELRAVQQRSEEVSALHASDVAERQVLQERMDSTVRRTEQLEQQLTLLAGRDTAADADCAGCARSMCSPSGRIVDAGRQPAAGRARSERGDPALASADARLARVPRSQFFALREALGATSTVAQGAVVDVTGSAIRLDRLVQGWTRGTFWPIRPAPGRRPAPKPRSEAAPPARFGWIERELGDTLRELVRSAPPRRPIRCC